MVTRGAMYLYVGVSITATSCLRRAGLEAITKRHFGISARLKGRGREGRHVHLGYLLTPAWQLNSAELKLSQYSRPGHCPLLIYEQ